MSIFLFYLVALVSLTSSQYVSRGLSDVMSDTLPGYDGKIPFKMYSGYLKATDRHFVHYWLVESRSAPAFDPLILWMNGGPGCSSLGGALEELGPFNLTDDVRLIVNEYSWNKKANILFIEAPAGVGFSYSADFNIATNDDKTADHNYAALKDFFFKFPQFSRHDFYVTGESYAGIYVPTLVERIIDGQNDTDINLVGLAIGNGVLNEDINTQTTIEFAYNHGLLDEGDYNKLVDQCCKGCEDGCMIHKAPDKYCKERAIEIGAMVWLGGLNPYDLYRNCWHNPLLGQTHTSNGYKVKLKWMAPPGVYDRLKRDSFDNETIIISDPTCSNETAITAYLNDPIVRSAFHIPHHVGYWTDCKGDVKWSYTKQYKDVAPQIRKALKHEVRVLIYNGDTDMVCNWLMGQRFTTQLGLPKLRGKQPWKYGDGQIGGFVTQYEGLDFATIKGAGHMAPGWRGEQMWTLLSRFLEKTNY